MLPFGFITDFDFKTDDVNYGRYVTQIRFPICKHWTFKKTLQFREPITIYQAIRKAEEYLSKPLTTVYLKKFMRDVPFNAHMGDCRGVLLCKMIFVKRIKYHGKGFVEIYLV